MSRRLPDDGRLLQVVAVAHAAVGAALYRDELRQIGRDRVVAAVPYRGDRATAFWFLVPSPLLWVLAGLMRRAEAAGDTEALRAAHGVSLGAAILATACLPISGFWAWVAISARGLAGTRRARKR